MESSEEESVDGPDARDACCGSLRGSSNAQAFEPSDRRYVVRSMALMLPSLTEHGKPPGAKAPVHSHTEVPGGTWHMDITSPTVDRSQAGGPTATRSQPQKAAAVQKAGCCAQAALPGVCLPKPPRRGRQRTA